MLARRDSPEIVIYIYVLTFTQDPTALSVTDQRLRSLRSCSGKHTFDRFVEGRMACELMSQVVGQGHEAFMSRYLSARYRRGGLKFLLDVCWDRKPLSSRMTILGYYETFGVSADGH